MTPMFLPLLIALSAGIGVYLPSPLDKGGIGLRIHNMPNRGPYIVGESIDRARYSVTLVNRSKAVLVHDPLVVARGLGDFDIGIVNPDGKRIVPPIPIPPKFPRDPFTAELKVRPGEFSTSDDLFSDWWSLSKAGRYQLVATWTIDGRKVTAPPLEFQVADILPEAVLSRIPVALDSEPKNPAKAPCVQQVKLGNKIVLVYTGSGVHRLAELPSNVKMTVEGKYGFGKPITIKYAGANSTTGTTTLTIDSIDGRPWTAQKERWYRDREQIVPTKP